jgi:hypothetical protein
MIQNPTPGGHFSGVLDYPKISKAVNIPGVKYCVPGITKLEMMAANGVDWSDGKKEDE